jgi:phospholipase/lecithinase/hemolysin
MLYVDAQLFYNLMSGEPSVYGLLNVTNPVCTSVDPGPGIGLGANQVNSALCTVATTSTATTPAATSYAQYLWADLVYPTPTGARAFGEYAFQRIRARW